MSAYGAILSPSNRREPLPSTIWNLSSTRTQQDGRPRYITIHHLTLATASPGLVQYLHGVFANELDRGMTYPQEVKAGETYTQEMFESYYFAGDVLVAVTGYEETSDPVDGGEVPIDVETARRGREWAECVAGCYYVKPNYPGRSSHICNAGFLVPPSQRGLGVGTALAKSFLHYAPRLGYEASVFNLVYVNNVASVKLWESLGFTKAGRIPRAGRLRKADSSGEEFVDAWIFYHRFSEGGV